MPFCLTMLLHFSHARDVEAEVNITEIAPETVFKYLAWRPVKALHQFNFSISQQRTERTFAFFRVAEQHAPVSPKPPVHAMPIGKIVGVIIYHRLVAQYFRVKFDGTVHVRNTDKSAVHAASAKTSRACGA